MTVRTGRTNRTTSVPNSARELAWRLHSNAEAASARADLKVSIMLAFQGSAFVLVATSRIIAFGSTHRLSSVAITVVLVLLLGAIAPGVAAIAPTLGSRREHRRDHPHQYIYFGHLRLWDRAALAARLTSTDADAEIEMLAPQMIAISRLTWRKHRLLQVSIAVTLVALSTLTLAVVTASA
jgi:hypothetical protein